MRIGIDFDNTLVCYDALFYKLASELKLIPESIEPRKKTIRDHLRANGKNDVWTELQGIAYGSRLIEAEPFPGVQEVLELLRNQGHTLTVISHKTQYPFAGPKVDLQLAAKNWLLRRNWIGQEYSTISEAFFLPTREEKIQQIIESRCEVFIDDLIEVLREPTFPSSTIPILFDPGYFQSALESEKHMKEWSVDFFRSLL